ncbi:MAG: hypothetical protein V8S16_00250 [Gemmiger sp.]|jgi:hypothetical protein|uniref:hypothetical protein n=1 Tax=Gemmiger sp. TaxID=2049027 RepID=UPI002058F77A|nr:MAG TPA: tail completion protein [Caudoviricetes sp.]DAZ76096.1 MAG TPA: tail completion protein [Caudoviricetes sp.]
MIETTVLDYLRDRLGVPVTMEVPEGASGTFVVLEKTGSSRQNYIRRATLAVQSYAPTLLLAAQLDDRVIEAMLALPKLDRVAACRLERDYNFTDTETKKYRYQAVFAVTYYE